MNFSDSIKIVSINRNNRIPFLLLISLLWFGWGWGVELSANDTGNPNSLTAEDLEVIRSIDSSYGINPTSELQPADPEKSGNSLLSLITLLLLFICVSLLVLSIWYAKILNQSRHTLSDLVLEKGEIESIKTEDLDQPVKYDYDSSEEKDSETNKPLVTEKLVKEDTSSVPIRLPKPRQKVALSKNPQNDVNHDSKTDLGEIIREVQIFRKSGDLKKAKELIESAEQSQTSSFELLLNKGIILEDLNSWEEALDCYEQAIAEEPKKPNGYLRKARLLEKMQNIRESWECYNSIAEKIA